MSLPRWVSPLGLVEHVVIGLAITALCVTTRQPPLMAVGLASLVGLWHELRDRDLLDAPGAPWNGLLDVAAFLVVPLGWALLGALT